MSVFAILERLAPRIEKEVNLVLNSKQEAETLSSKLKKIQVGLEDAEKKGATDGNVRDWLKELEDVSYDMDDVLDEWETANLQVQLQGSEDLADPWEKVRSFVLSLCLCFKHVVGRREITKKIKALSDRIDKILEEKGKYKLVSGESVQSSESNQDESTPAVNKLEVCGRELETNSLIEKLVPEGKNNDVGTKIISIVGTGGVGKTTLAQLAFNDPKVQDNFEDKAWVSVSNPFSASEVAKAILEAVGKSSADVLKLNTLGQMIKEALEKRRFLLVLDNMWLENRMEWDRLKNYLHGAPGSRILVTTRSESVARMIGTTEWQQLGLLSDLDCGTVLNGIALHGRTQEECEKLKDIGIEIARKCDGLPLAAKTLGSMLALRLTEPEWLDVLENPLWKYEDEVSDLFRLLKLSYIDLSPLLKRCFLSCIVCPKGTSVNVDELIRIWMAYGYLSSSHSAQEVRSKGIVHFRKLEMRSFFQKLESDGDDGGMDWYKMHDILHDFANYLSGSEYNFIMDGGVVKEKNLPSQRAQYNIPFSSLGRVRTFCASRISLEELALAVISHLKSVRVLTMRQCRLQELPNEVGKLIHLRYLNLSGNPIRELPETVSDLYNLQTLGLEKCYRLSRLPEGIDKLINLRHILNSGAYDLKQFPQGLEKLTGLWTLSEFTVMEASELGYLGNLNQLHGSLFISLQGLNDSTDSLEQVRKANLKSKNHIQKLELLFHDEVLTDDVVGALEPPPNLQSLGVKCKTGKWLPKWINATCFNSLKVVKFNGRGRCFDLPPFGKLPGLEKLVIINCDFNCLSKELLGIRFVLEDGPSKASPEWAGWSPWSGYSPNVRPPMLTSSDGAGRFPGSDNVIKVRPSVPTSSVGAGRFPGSDNVIKVRPSVPTTSVGAGRFPGPDNVIKVGPSVPTSAVGAGWFPGSANITKVRPAFPTSSQVVGWFPRPVTITKVQPTVPTSSHGVGWFPKLKKLHIKSCNSWREWEDIMEESQVLVRIMPQLEELEIIRCDFLEILPHTFLRQATRLRSLKIASYRLKDRYAKDLGPDWDKISHIPHVQIGLRSTPPPQVLVSLTAALRDIDNIA